MGSNTNVGNVTGAGAVVVTPGVLETSPVIPEIFPQAPAAPCTVYVPPPLIVTA